MRIDGATTRTSLARDARTVHVSVVGTAPVPHLPQGALTREEADLLEVPFDPLLLDRLRPAGPPAVGATWTVAADAAAGLLTIDTIENGELTGHVTDIAEGRSTLQISGTIHGAVDGVPTRLVVDAVGRLPVRPADAGEGEAAAGWEFAGPPDRWTATIREHRQASHVAPGFEVEARVVVSRRPAPAEAIAEGRGAGGDAAGGGGVSTPRRPAGGGPGRLWYRDPAGRYDLVHDARWRLVEEGDTGAVFRLVDRGALVAQCSVTALPRGDAATSVADVQRDVERSLGGDFGRFAEAGESVREDGTRIVRVVSVGRAGNLPFRWLHHVLVDPQGRRAAAAFMVEESLVARFGDADRDLIAGLRFTPAAAVAGAGVVSEAGTGVEAAGDDARGNAGENAVPEPPADREARLPRETATP